MSWQWSLVYREVDENDVPAPEKIPNYPPGVLDNVPPDFKARTKYSSTHPECVVLLYTDGREESPSNVGSYTYASYKGIAGKKVSYLGKLGGGRLPVGQSVMVTCGFPDCINQQHLVGGPIYHNRNTRRQRNVTE